MIKTSSQIQYMQTVGQLTASVLEMITPFVKPGISTFELDQICNQYIVNDLKAIPSTLNHQGFPASICTSLNHVVCHGIPSHTEILKDGDILNIDVTVKKNGFLGDSSKMFVIGNAKPFAKKLVDVTQQCLYDAIRIVKPGTYIGDIGYIISKKAQSYGYSVVKDYCGHGIGESMWEEPQVPHYGRPNTGLQLKEGMTFTIEPMLNLGTDKIVLLPDGWTEITKDKKLSAQWEHTILVTNSGYEVLTLRDEEKGFI